MVSVALLTSLRLAESRARLQGLQASAKPSQARFLAPHTCLANRLLLCAHQKLMWQFLGMLIVIAHCVLLIFIK